MYDVLHDIFVNTHKINVETNTKIKFKKIFDTLESVEYYDKIPKFLNNRMTKDNNKIVKTCMCILSKNLYYVK